MRDLIERLRSVNWDVIDDDDWDSRCVFVDMRPDDFEALLTEAAAALEAARADAERYRWLKQHAFCGVWHRGDGLALVAPRVIQREVDAAIDTAMKRTTAREGERLAKGT